MSNGREAKIHGLITGRNGAEMTVKTQDGTNVTVELTDSTKVEEKQGKLGLRKKEMAVMGLIPD